MQEPTKRNIGPWWKPGVQAFSEVWTWIVVPIVAALIIGKWLDKHFGTGEILFMISAGVGFVVTALGIIFTIKKYAQKLKDDERT